MNTDKIKELIANTGGQIGLLLKNLKTGEVIMAHNEGMVFPSASTIKLPILLCLLDEALEGKLDLNEEAAVSPIDMVEGSGLLRHMSASLQSWRDHALLMITVSDNASTNHLISRLGMDKINAKIRSIPMHDTVLGRKMMDFEARSRGMDNFTSCLDMLALFDHFFKNTGKYGEALNILKQQQHNGLLAGLLDSDSFEFAHKTGGLKRIRHDIGIMYLRDPIFTAFMSKETEETRALNLAHKIGLEVYENFRP